MKAKVTKNKQKAPHFPPPPSSMFQCITGKHSPISLMPPLSKCWHNCLVSQLCENLKNNENAATVLCELLVDIFSYFVIFKGENNGGICALVLSAHLHAQAERYPFIINFMHYFISWC